MNQNRYQQQLKQLRKEIYDLCYMLGITPPSHKYIKKWPMQRLCQVRSSLKATWPHNIGKTNFRGAADRGVRAYVPKKPIYTERVNMK